MRPRLLTESDGAPDAPTATPGDGSVVTVASKLLQGVQVALKAKVGETTLSVEELLALKAGSVVKLDAKITDFIELRLGDELIARGEIVAVGDHFGIRIAEIAEIA